jgi:signal transduction histidine kinase
MEKVVQQLATYHKELVDWLRKDLEDTLFSNSAFIRPAHLNQLATGEADAFLDFLQDEGSAAVRAQGAKRADQGLGEQAVLRMGATLRRFCHTYLEGQQLRAGLAATDVYTSAFLEGFIKARVAIVLNEQERIRAALQRAISRYTLQLQTAAEVAQVASSVLDMDKLLISSVDLIRDRSNFYYVGLFLVDEHGEWAVLRAGTGEAGREMLQRGQKLKVGGKSIIGLCIAQSKARVVSDVRTEPGDSARIYLPKTRSAIALPLVSRGRVIGAMIFQSTRVAAFSDEDTTRLLADLLSNAIENARLFAAAQQEISERKRAEEALAYLNRRLTALLEVAAGMETTARPDELPFHLVSALVNRLSYDLAGLWELDDHVLRSKCSAIKDGYAAPSLSEFSEIPADGGIFGRVIRTGQSVFVLDVGQEPDYRGSPDTRSEICCSLQDATGIMGVLDVESREPLNEGDFAVVQAAARLVATALTNAQLYEQIQRQTSELEVRVAERTAKLAAVNKELEAFAYSVSHDLRAPLRSMDGFSQALLEDYANRLDAEGRDYLHRVRAASQRMGQLIDDLLTLSRITRSELRYAPVDLSALAQAIAAELEQRDSERQVEFVIAEGLVADGDARLLRVVLENLLDNAWKFTSKHASARIELSVAQIEGRTVYFVGDDGAGFDMAHTDRLFGSFQRLHTVAEFEGNGIGLATVQRIITRHGGRIWAKGKVEQGATFYFTL